MSGADDRAIELLRRMVAIPSPSGQEAQIAEYLTETMADLGFRNVAIDAAGNATGMVERGPGPHVMLLGHMDTETGEVPPGIRGGLLYGRGAVDAKGPLAAMICAAERADFTGKVTVVGAVEEETPQSRGAVQVRETYGVPDAVIIGEPSGWSSVVVGYKGKLDVRYRVTQPAAHPASPAPKAAEMAVSCWNKVQELLGPTITHASFDEPGLTLVAIVGDPASAQIDFSVRTPPGFDTCPLMDTLRDHSPDGELTVLNDIAACVVSPRNPVVRSLSGGIRAQRGQPVLKKRTGTSDMNTLAKSWQVPMATYGPGDNTLDHSDEEHIVLDEYLKGIEVLASALTRLSTTLREEDCS
jgi:[amino group carrier protein]-lysine/ornithine hydrolase